jgi:hypothetical protein
MIILPGRKASVGELLRLEVERIRERERERERKLEREK